MFANGGGTGDADCNSEVVWSAGFLKLVPRGDTALSLTVTPITFSGTLNIGDTLNLTITGLPGGSVTVSHVARLRQKRRDLRRILRRRRIVQALQPVPVIRSPGCPLMREDMRLVKMEHVDDIGIG